MTELAPYPSDAAGTDSIIGKLLWRLVGPLTLLTFINAIDRVNISFAAQTMGKDIGLGPQSFGFGVSLFFVAYLAFQLPHAYFLRRFGIKWWLLISLLLWGAAGLGMASVTTVHGFYSMRFLLGVAESGFAPGITYYVGRTVPMRARAKAMGLVLSAIPLSFVLGGPLCGWMLDTGNPLDLPAWRWMFVLQALPNFFAAGIAFYYFTDRIEDFRWLSAAQRRSLTVELGRSDAPPAPHDATHAALRDPRTLLCALLWLLVMTGSYALLFWLPQLVRQMALGRSELQIGAISSLPQAGLVLGMLVNGWHSDRSNERPWHFGIGAVGAGLALLLSAALPPGWLVLGLLIAAGIGIGAAQGVFWTIPAALRTDGTRVPISVISLINMSGTLGGVIGPGITGFVRERTGSFTPAIDLLASLLLATSVVLVVLARTNRPSTTSLKVPQ